MFHFVNTRTEKVTHQVRSVGCCEAPRGAGAVETLLSTLVTQGEHCNLRSAGGSQGAAGQAQICLLEMG